MAESIKGLTVKIGADTSDFVKGLKKVDKEINATAKTAQELEKSLRLDYDDQRFIQAQKKAQQALDTTNEKAEAIRKQLKYLEESGNVDTEGYRKLETELAKTEANALKLKQRLEEIEKIKIENATKKISAFGSGLEKAGAATRAFSAAAAGAVVGAYQLTKQTAAAAAEIQDYSDRLNISAEAIQRWDYIAEQSGVETDQLTKAIAKGRDAIGTALTGGTNTATKALEKLLGGLHNIPSGTEEGFSAIITALSKVTNSTEQAYYANEIFGERIATNLLPMINNSAERMSQLNAEFESTGYLTNEQTQGLADFDDQLNIFNREIKMSVSELGSQMIPVVKELIAIFRDNVLPMIKNIASAFSNMSEGTRSTIVTITLLSAVLSPLLTMSGKVISIIPKIIKLMSGLNVETVKSVAAWGGLLVSIGAVIGVLANWDNMSGIQKVIGLVGALTAAVLSAAVAFGVFHSAWSIGLATAGIVAGIAASVTAINEAKKNIDVPANIPDYNVNDYTSAVTGGTPTTPSENAGSYTEDNSQYNINVEMNTTGELNYDAKQLADEVIRQIVIKKQAAGG